MTDIQHVLYNTVGDEFEKYLGPEELMIMSKVSNITRMGNISNKFRYLLQWTMQEYTVFKNNNRGEYNTLSRFFKSIPICVIYRDANLPEGTNIIALLDYLHVDSKAREYVFIELASLNDWKRYLNNRNNLTRTILDEYIRQASMRLRPDIVETVYQHHKYSETGHGYIDKLYYDYYPITRELRDVYIRYNPDIITYLNIYTNGVDDSFGLANGTMINDYEPLTLMIYYSTSFQEQDSFRDYFRMYYGEIPERLDTMLNNKKLKYNISAYKTQYYLN